MLELIKKYLDPDLLRQAADVLEELSTTVMDAGDTLSDLLDEWSDALANLAGTDEPSLEDKWEAVKTSDMAQARSPRIIAIMQATIDENGIEQYAGGIEALYNYHVLGKRSGD